VNCPILFNPTVPECGIKHLTMFFMFFNETDGYSTFKKKALICQKKSENLVLIMKRNKPFSTSPNCTSESYSDQWCPTTCTLINTFLKELIILPCSRIHVEERKKWNRSQDIYLLGTLEWSKLSSPLFSWGDSPS
jgi:hypothetical protein